MLKKFGRWTFKDIIYLPIVFILWPLVSRNYYLREKHIIPDEWYWADIILFNCGYAVLSKSEREFMNRGWGPFLLVGNDERSIINLAKMIKDLTNSTSKIEFLDQAEDDPKTRNPDITKAKNILSWEPRVSTEEGVRKTITYFKAA